MTYLRAGQHILSSTQKWSHTEQQIKCSGSWLEHGEMAWIMCCQAFICLFLPCLQITLIIFQPHFSFRAAHEHGLGCEDSHLLLLSCPLQHLCMLFGDFQTIVHFHVKIHPIHAPQVRHLETPAVARSDVTLKVISPTCGTQNQRRGLQRSKTLQDKRDPS